MDVKIGKKKYTLEKISIYISDLYVAYVRSQNEMLTMEADFEGLRLECEIAREEAESTVDKLKASLKMFKDARQLKKTALDGAIEASKMRNKILEEIVLLNGYEYKEDDWLKNFSESQFSELIDELMGHKKKAEVSST